jgi:hypothetical protein
MRLAYPQVRETLTGKITEMRNGMLAYDIKLAESLEQGELMSKINPFRARYLHLYNLKTLFEFCIPVIQDYGVALKNNDWQLFMKCFVSLVLFYVMCNGQGVLEYQRSLYCFFIMLRYWTYHQLPVITLLQANHTLFSEESGEIALSVLTTSQPSNNRTKLDQVQKAWKLLRVYSHLRSEGAANKSQKKHRILSKSYFSFFPSFVYPIHPLPTSQNFSTNSILSDFYFLPLTFVLPAYFSSGCLVC